MTFEWIDWSDGRQPTLNMKPPGMAGPGGGQPQGWHHDPDTGRPWLFHGDGSQPMGGREAAGWIAEQHAAAGGRQKVAETMRRLGEPTTVLPGRVINPETGFIRQQASVSWDASLVTWWLAAVRLLGEPATDVLVVPFVGVPVVVASWYGAGSERRRVIPVGVQVVFQPDGKVWCSTTASFESEES